MSEEMKREGGEEGGIFASGGREVGRTDGAERARLITEGDTLPQSVREVMRRLPQGTK